MKVDSLVEDHLDQLPFKSKLQACPSFVELLVKHELMKFQQGIPRVLI